MITDVIQTSDLFEIGQPLVICMLAAIFSIIVIYLSFRIIKLEEKIKVIDEKLIRYAKLQIQFEERHKMLLIQLNELGEKLIKQTSGQKPLKAPGGVGEGERMP